MLSVLSMLSVFTHFYIFLAFNAHKHLRQECIYKTEQETGRK